MFSHIEHKSPAQSWLAVLNYQLPSLTAEQYVRRPAVMLASAIMRT